MTHMPSDMASALEAIAAKLHAQQPDDADTQPDASHATAEEPTPRVGRLDIALERRRGKDATIIAGFPDAMSDQEIERIASRLKQTLGCGGSARGGEILLQGDRRKTLPDTLRRLFGYSSRVI